MKIHSYINATDGRDVQVHVRHRAAQRPSGGTAARISRVRWRHVLAHLLVLMPFSVSTMRRA
jgi:hypothetical protein